MPLDFGLILHFTRLNLPRAGFFYLIGRIIPGVYSSDLSISKDHYSLLIIG
jgi:hypothetical protein